MIEILYVILGIGIGYTVRSVIQQLIREHQIKQVKFL